MLNEPPNHGSDIIIYIGNTTTGFNIVIVVDDDATKKFRKNSKNVKRTIAKPYD